MNLFRRTMSSSSSKSRASTADSASDTLTQRTSLGSEYDNDISTSLTTIKQKTTTPPILSLPIELVQQITTYLDSASAASFCLSSRFICYAIGTNHLSSYIEASKSRFEKRRTIEAIVERAFPGHWFCAWCDKFHAWSADEGPQQSDQKAQASKTRDCTEFNSYLPAGPNYTLSYHHIRLAINRSLWGTHHGIPLSFFTHTTTSTTNIFKTPAPTTLHTTARIAQHTNHFLLHSTFTLVLPAWSTSNKRLLNQHIWPALPHILSGHRNSENGHTGLMAAIDNVVRRGWTYPYTQVCATCKTDWIVECVLFPQQNQNQYQKEKQRVMKAMKGGGQARLTVQTWRDLGTGRNPFDTAWRAHGVTVPVQTSCATATATAGAAHMLRSTHFQAGEIRRAFERSEEEDGGGELRSETQAGKRRTCSRSRIYKSFMMGRELDDDEQLKSTEVRRSRVRPCAWRTRSENDEVQRQDEDERLEMVRDVAEELVRLGG